MSKGLANTCIFKETSDESEHAGISKEHLWSDWLSQLLPLGRADPMHTQIKTSIFHNPEGILEIIPTNSGHRGPMNSRKVRIVCKKCNSGWMSLIEVAVKEIMTKLILGECKVVTVDQQKFLCQWMVLKSIVGEYTDEPMKAISEFDRMYLKNNLSVPPNWKIWIGNFLGGEKEWRQKYSHSGATCRLAGEPVPAVPNCQTTTFVMNELFIHAASMPDFLLDKWMPSQALVQIWPSTDEDIQWPPKLPIGDEEAKIIAHLLRQPIFYMKNIQAAHLYVEPEIFDFVKEEILRNGQY